MKREKVAEIAKEVVELAIRVGWNREAITVASTGSIYIDLTRKRGEEKEWVVIRVADHKQFYHRWLTTYSHSPYEYDDEMLIELLSKSFGEVGDVF